MSQTIANFVLLMATASMPPSSEEIAKLVAQLGDLKFAVREAAQRELLKKGEAIVPELDKLAKTADAETVERLRKIRLTLVGYQDEIRKLLYERALDRRDDNMSIELRRLIASNQPSSGNFLLSMIVDREHPDYARSAWAFIQSLDTASVAQVEQFLRRRMTLKAHHRSEYPALPGVTIPTEAALRGGWQEWFPEDRPAFPFSTRTTRYVDGKPYGKPLEHVHPFRNVGGYRIDELAPGKHTIHAVMEYEFTHRGENRRGEFQSEKTSFIVLPANAPDDLIAPKSASLASKVQAALIIRDNPRLLEQAIEKLPSKLESETDWRPMTTWPDSDGKWSGLTCPLWRLKDALDVDLCFDVEIHDVKSGKIYPVDPICLLRGQTIGGRLIPRNLKEFVKDRDGFVTVKVVLAPSRIVALSNPKVTKYFPEPITTDEMRIKILKSLPPPRNDF